MAAVTPRRVPAAALDGEAVVAPAARREEEALLAEVPVAAGVGRRLVEAAREERLDAEAAAVLLAAADVEAAAA